jgi:rfaE bifunctional protein nucleotidyltransferase chain/domain
MVEADAVLICDYGSHTMLALAERLASLGRAAVRARPLVVDAHEPGRWQELAPDVVTPNAAEAAAALGVPPPERDRAGFFAGFAPRLHRVTGADTVVVTLDRDGAIALTSGRLTRTHAHPAAEQHASGAGDVFAAAMTAALASGSTVVDAVDFAQGASDVAVHKSGTSLCTAMDLAAWFDAGPLPVMSRAALLSEIGERRAAGERIVFTNGCFDVLHSGHTHYLRQAKRLGDVLVVALNDDDSVRRLKGSDRPINGVVDRARVLSALACVDYVTTFSEDSPVDLLSAVRPDVYVKGGDYSPDMLEEADVVRAAGGEVVIVDYVADHSTTALVRRIQAGRHQANT